VLRIVEADIDEANKELRELEQSLQAAKDQQKVIQNRHKELISDQKQAEKDKQKLEVSKIKVATEVKQMERK
jgi:chromosome segregation ATPase